VRRRLKPGLDALREHAPGAPIEFVRRADFRRGLFYALAAAVVLGVGSNLGAVHSHSTKPRIIAYAAAGAFLVLGALAVRSTASQLAFATELRGGRSAAATVRLISVFVGYVVVLFITLDSLDVPVQRLLVGGALTGVVLGIAAQQSLGNVFAGLVLLLARPFALGDEIRVRYGAWGGELDGVVVGIGLTYVSLRCDDGLLVLPNAGVLAAAVGPRPPSVAAPSPAAVTAATQAVAAAQAALTAAGAMLTLLPGGEPATEPAGEPPVGG
jgi:hypothetical protein